MLLNGRGPFVLFFLHHNLNCCIERLILFTHFYLPYSGLLTIFSLQMFHKIVYFLWLSVFDFEIDFLVLFTVKSTKSGSYIIISPP